MQNKGQGFITLQESYQAAKQDSKCLCPQSDSKLIWNNFRKAMLLSGIPKRSRSYNSSTLSNGGDKYHSVSRVFFSFIRSLTKQKHFFRLVLHFLLEVSLFSGLLAVNIYFYEKETPNISLVSPLQIWNFKSWFLNTKNKARRKLRKTHAAAAGSRIHAILGLLFHAYWRILKYFLGIHWFDKSVYLGLSHAILP